ncbi:hypothetical protein F5B22DRAFT_596216 [Xylaria bambusicola]|uniref:uncharacterized protein n=1 Tax=Xylaria bambusicola TaxID=326684 RepID=UPI002008701D|nr:uncharacterized protein F5B22DRAFT_596216 [Xylaria bambusicola]KAI0521221.1 hypothetical protein F5B22DRAFT_596216 [Xylaria bambusicola]
MSLAILETLEDSMQDQPYTHLINLPEQSWPGLSSMSASVYDTAWLSMVKKPSSSGGASNWLFPECFEFILKQQLPSGAWESYATPMDGILNTSAALLALRTRVRTQSNGPNHDELMVRSSRAEVALKQLLSEWVIAQPVDQGGPEYLVISLLELLKNEGVSIEFPGQGILRAIRGEVLARYSPLTIYQTTSKLHGSLEGFVGHVNFDEVRLCRDRNGSIMGSPASTAAYLMNCSDWDHEAEAYLQSVVAAHEYYGQAGVPSAWPTNFSEVFRMAAPSTSAGLCVKGANALDLSNVMEESFENRKLSDPSPRSLLNHDTATKCEAPYSMDYTSPSDVNTRPYEGNTCLDTCSNERAPGFSANCSALISLLECENRHQNLPQIAKILRHLVDIVFKGCVQDNRSLNELYWMMLLTRAFELLFSHHQLASALFNVDVNLRCEIPMIALHILSKILQTQQSDGSWDNNCEITSYGVLTLASLSKLPSIQQLGDNSRVPGAIASAKSYLHQNKSEWRTGCYHWIGKVTYKSPVLSEAYCLAAAAVPTHSDKHIDAGGPMRQLFFVPWEVIISMRKSGELLARTPMFRKSEAFTLRMAELKAAFAMQLLDRQTPAIFPRTAKGKDKYIFFIPLVLTACAELYGCTVSLSSIYEVMVLSVLNFHVDEFIEGVIERHFMDNLDAVRNVVVDLCEELSLESTTKNDKDGEKANEAGCNELKASSISSEENVEAKENRPSIAEVRNVLRQYVAYILHHQDVLSSPAALQRRLARDLQTFLLAHLSHAEDNRRLRAQLDSCIENSIQQQENHPTQAVVPSSLVEYQDAKQSFYQWVRSTSADHTSCPFSFFFFNCLTYAASSPAKQARGGILASARTAYLAEDACRHLATTCRMYNDLGSTARDADERNLNSTNFPEFSARQSHHSLGGDCVDLRTKAKDELLWLARYEEKGLKMSLDLLEEELGDANLMSHLRFFVNVTELYGQIYVLKDVGTRTQ